MGASTKVVEITDARPAVLAGIRAALTARSAGRPRAASRAPAFEEEKRTGHIDWTEALRDKPVDDLLDGIDLGSVFRRKDAVDSVVSWLEQGTYRGWEAALRAEQQLPLTDAHEEALDELVSVSDDDEDGTVSTSTTGLDRPSPGTRRSAASRRTSWWRASTPGMHTARTC